MLDIKEIMEIIKGIDDHLRRLEAMTGLMKDIKSTLIDIKNNQERAINYEFQKLRQDQNDLVLQLKKYGLPETNQYEKDLQEIRSTLESNEWPDAVPQEHICGDNEEMANLRANSILDMVISEPIRGHKFLDYGCGSGHISIKAIERDASLVIGYDIDKRKFKFDNKCFTDNFETVKSNGPYDIILMHDVLDHIQMIDPVQALIQAKSVLSIHGKIYIQNHPWSSRHGGHVYTKKNKAFLHLILDDMELARTGGWDTEHNIKVITPLETYRFWIKEAGLNIVGETPIKNEVEDFFLKPSPINARIKHQFKEPETMKRQLEISFVEYILQHQNSNKQII